MRSELALFCSCPLVMRRVDDFLSDQLDLFVVHAELNECSTSSIDRLAHLRESVLDLEVRLDV